MVFMVNVGRHMVSSVGAKTSRDCKQEAKVCFLFNKMGRLKNDCPRRGMVPTQHLIYGNFPMYVKGLQMSQGPWTEFINLVLRRREQHPLMSLI